MKKRQFMALGCTLVLSAALLAECGGNQNSENIAQLEEIEETDDAVQNASEETTTAVVQVTAVDGNQITADVGELTQAQMGEKPGGGNGPEGGTPPERPSGEAPRDGETPGSNEQGGTLPERPDGEAPRDGETQGSNEQGGTPPERPSGEAPRDGETQGNNEQGGTLPERPSGEAPTDGETPGSNEQGGTPPEKPSGEKPDGNMPSGAGFGGSSFTGSGESITFTVTDDTTVTVEFLQGSSEGSMDDIAVGSVLEIELDSNNQAVSVVVRNLNAGGGFGGSSEVTNGTAANTIDEDGTYRQETYTSTGDDENALRVDGATVTLDQITVTKESGSSSNTENGDFYGANAGLLVCNGVDVTITGATVNTSVVNGNGVFSYGEGTVVNISDSTIRTTQNNSGGIQTTGGGTMNATNLDVETQGNSAAAIRSDRGGGTVNVTGGSYVTNGTGSPAVYCTADISVSNATLTANASEGVVVEGKNSVSLKDCDVTGNMSNTYHGDSDENIHNIMIYQSMSGDADIGEAYFSAEGGSITAKAGDMFYVTNTDCEINLKGVAFTLANDTFLRIEGNSSSRGWGTQGANGGDVVITADYQQIEGNILVDSISTLKLTMQNGSSFSGAVNPDGEGGQVDVTLSADSTWTLTGDSYISCFDGDYANVDAGSYHLYVAGEQVL